MASDREDDASASEGVPCDRSSDGCARASESVGDGDSSSSYGPPECQSEAGSSERIGAPISSTSSEEDGDISGMDAPVDDEDKDPSDEEGPPGIAEYDSRVATRVYHALSAREGQSHLAPRVECPKTTTVRKSNAPCFLSRGRMQDASLEGDRSVDADLGAGSNGVSTGSNGEASSSNGGSPGSNGGASSSNGGASSSNGGASNSNGGSPGSNGGASSSNGGAPGSNSDAPRLKSKGKRPVKAGEGSNSRKLPVDKRHRRAVKGFDLFY